MTDNAPQAAQAPHPEVTAFQLPGVVDAKEPPIYRDYFEKIAPKVGLGQTAWTILEAFANIDVTAEKFGQALRGNPYLEHQFFEVLNSYKKRENVETIESAVILLGMENSRNLILAFQMLRVIKGEHPVWTKEGKLQTSPSDLLKYATKTEEVLEHDNSDYADTAYAAGFLFDVLAMIADTLVADKTEKKKLLTYIDVVYAHGLQTAKIGAQIVNRTPSFGLKKLAFSGCLIHDVGKIVMAMLDPSYLAFVDSLGKTQLPRTLRHYAEGRRFGLNHTVLGADICYLFRIFRILDLPILHHHTPFLLRGHSKNLSQMAALICLSTNIANNFRKVDKLDDPVFNLWKGPELTGFTFDPAVIKAALQAVV